MFVVENMYSKKTCDNIEYTYSYRLTKTNVQISTSKGKNYVQAYGIEAERKDMSDGVIVNVERESVKVISPERHKVHNLLKILCDNSVSPIHFIDVLGEYIDEYANDFENVLDDVAMN